MKVRSLVLAAFAALCASSAHGININQSAFTANGGDLQDIAGTAPNVFDQLRTASNAPQFNAVGNVGLCTGTWLGTEGNHAWVLTAAHCVLVQPFALPADQLRFRDGQGRQLAGGPGTKLFVHPDRLNRPQGMSENATDIAMLKMPLLPLEAGVKLPVGAKLHDRGVDMDGNVALVGHGSVGVGQVPVDAFWPASGERRAWGEMRISRVQDHGYVGVSNYIPGNSTTNWTRASVGDGGAAWWQYHNREWSVVAVTNGGHASSTSGVFVEKYAAWIKGLYPGARIASDAMRVSETGSFLSHNHALDAPKGEVYFLIAPNQPGVEGPTQKIWTGMAAFTRLTVPVRNALTGEVRPMKLRGHRLNGCGKRRIEDGVSCGHKLRQGTMQLWHEAVDNPGFPQGRWTGRVKFDAQGWHSAYQKSFDVDVDVMVGTSAKVTRTSRYVSPNYALEVDHGSVYYVVAPDQPDVIGPTKGIWGGYRLHTQLAVPAVDAVTGQTHLINLRAYKDLSTCNGKVPMQDGVLCKSLTRVGSLEVWFDPKDNPSLPVGIHRGTVHIDVHGWHRPLHRQIKLDVEIDTLN